MTADVPRWWNQPAADWPAFHDALRWAMDIRGETLPSPLGPTLTVGRDALALDRLAAGLRTLKVAKWPAATARHLADHGEEAVRGSSPAHATELDAVRPRLLPRAAVPIEVQVRVELAPDVVGTLAIVEPFGDGERWVTAQDIAGWERSAKQVWDIGVANLGHDHVELTHRGALTFATGDDPNVAAHVLRLPNLHPRPAPDGFLVGLPSPAVLLFTPLEGADWVLLLRELPAIMTGLSGGALGFLSPHVHWVADGRFEQVAEKGGDDNISIVGSERFSVVANRVLRAAAGG